MILVTGGAGFIGSHTCVSLAAAGIPFLILDNFCNSRRSVVERVSRITGVPTPCVEGDVRDGALLARIFEEQPITAVVHFAALKSVEESSREPLRYYDNNVSGTLNLLAEMRKANVQTFVFSSSATVYGEPASLPIKEDFPLSATNAYGWSKLMTEQILADLDSSEPGRWRIARLRYFNPVGAHESGMIGEDSGGIPSNLMPYVAQVAGGIRERLSIYGTDYPTPDGTGVRDYIHVCDLAEGHVAALRYLNENPGLLTVNLGTGVSVSVLEMVKAFEKVSGQPIPYQAVARRPGDVAACWADPARAARLLKWRTRHGLDRMCEDAWRWQMAATSAL